jgi:putative ABC transport system substrate-binding protein
VTVIAGNHNAALAAKAATGTVPIIVATGADLVRDNLVAILNRPGGNVIGVSYLAGVLGAKRLVLFPYWRKIGLFCFNRLRRFSQRTQSS